MSGGEGERVGNMREREGGGGGECQEEKNKKCTFFESAT
jgi:hypothetical protein